MLIPKTSSYNPFDGCYWKSLRGSSKTGKLLISVTGKPCTKAKWQEFVLSDSPLQRRSSRGWVQEEKFKKWRQKDEWDEDKQAETLFSMLPLPQQCHSTALTVVTTVIFTVAWHWNFGNNIETTGYFFCFHMLSAVVKKCKILINSCHCRRLDFCCWLFMILWPLLT